MSRANYIIHTVANVTTELVEKFMARSVHVDPFCHGFYAVNKGVSCFV